MKSYLTFILSVEAYCFYENKWTKLPDMLKERTGHGSVSIGNKMFVISRNLNDSCEVFDSITNKFILLKTNPHVKNIEGCLLKAFAITVGYKIHILLDKEFLGEKRRVSTFCYDVIGKSWTS